MCPLVARFSGQTQGVTGAPFEGYAVRRPKTVPSADVSEGELKRCPATDVAGLVAKVIFAPAVPGSRSWLSSEFTSGTSSR